MKKYFRYSLALIVGGTLLSLVGCGSSGTDCSNGQVNSQFGCASSCGTNMVTQPGTSSCVANSLNSGGYTCGQYAAYGYTLVSAPSPYNAEPPISETGGEICCSPQVAAEISAEPAIFPEVVSQCTLAQSGTGYSATGCNGYTQNGLCIPY